MITEKIVNELTLISERFDEDSYEFFAKTGVYLILHLHYLPKKFVVSIFKNPNGQNEDIKSDGALEFHIKDDVNDKLAISAIEFVKNFFKRIEKELYNEDT